MNFESVKNSLGVDELFHDTLSKEIYSKEQLALLVPNIDGKEYVDILNIESHFVNTWGNQINQAHSFMMRCLAEFMSIPGNEKYLRIGIENPLVIKLIEKSYEFKLKSMNPAAHGMYGNFDFTIDQNGDIKIYEYNGQTPTLLYETIAVQDKFIQNMDVDNDEQFNLTYENLVELFEYYNPEQTMCFAALPDHMNDVLTIEVLASAATDAGIKHVEIVDVASDIEFDSEQKAYFMAGTDIQIDTLFMLFPYEEMTDEIYGEMIQCYDKLLSGEDSTVIAEPFFKLLLSNKGFMAFMTEYSKDGVIHNGFIPTYLSEDMIYDANTLYVEKPIFGRMSANIRTFETDCDVNIHDLDVGVGEYADSLTVIQEHTPMVSDAHWFIKNGEGRNVVFRMWMTPMGLNPAVWDSTSIAVRATTNSYNMEIESEMFIPHHIGEA